MRSDSRQIIGENQGSQISNAGIAQDISIAAAALGIGPNDLISDLKTFGFLLETLCVRALRIFADALNGNIYHFRNKNGLECDAVIHLRNGQYGLTEIKLGGEKLINEGAANLKTLEGDIDTDKMKNPAFLMVLTGTGNYAYRRHAVYDEPLRQAAGIDRMTENTKRGIKS